MSTFRYATIQVTVTDSGLSRSRGSMVRSYAVTVRGTGSAARLHMDVERPASHEVPVSRIAAETLEDLLSAGTEPRHFIAEYMGQTTGLEARKRARQAEKIVAAVRRIGVGAIEDAVESARERGAL